MEKTNLEYRDIFGHFGKWGGGLKEIVHFDDEGYPYINARRCDSEKRLYIRFDGDWTPDMRLFNRVAVSQSRDFSTGEDWHFIDELYSCLCATDEKGKLVSYNVVEDACTPKSEASQNTPINWEQRRWKLAAALFVEHSDFSTPYDDISERDAISAADSFIAEYKKSLNTEE